jgi:ribosomal protein uS19
VPAACACAGRILRGPGADALPSPRLRPQKKEATAGEKPEPVRTHLRDMVIVPEMIGSVIGVYNGKTFNQVEIKVRGARLRLGWACD